MSTFATFLSVESNGINIQTNGINIQTTIKFLINAWAFIRNFMVVCIFDNGMKGQCLSFNLVPSFVF